MLCIVGFGIKQPAGWAIRFICLERGDRHTRGYFAAASFTTLPRPLEKCSVKAISYMFTRGRWTTFICSFNDGRI